MGIVGGGLFNFIGGARNAPTGFRRRALGGLVRMREKAPVLGGQFASWCLVFASCECTLSHLRQKEDPWNSILSGAGAGAIMVARFVLHRFHDFYANLSMKTLCLPDLHQNSANSRIHQFVKCMKFTKFRKISSNSLNSSNPLKASNSIFSLNSLKQNLQIQ